ncbi:Putative leucine-rich repeat domain superfamily [Septoria linicola]|uniref:Leucine-rich repeat domain superfamily n=1 Tax=Septoria linicola TaxID=215465 RepID=A0A9Q9AUR2_9PEZI|nr:putative leucine-rich repeat domain superfamily [Septoria linicola]USW55759.1 Putative leucine-rich repeat domain superfamily [Septoria linicola]
MDASRLLTLPEELIAVIADHISVESLLDFALASPETYRHTKHRLEKNQRYHGELRIQHDHLPLQAPKLLRTALSDSEAIWHVRAFESWGARPGFQKWKTWRFYEDITEEEQEEWLGPPEDHTSLDADFYEPEELVHYRMIMMDVLHMSPSNVYKWIERIRDGWDEPIKGLLFALAPRLDRLNFIAYDSWQSTEYQGEDPLGFLCLAIRSVYDSLSIGAAWPPGFMSLRMVSICNSTSLRHPHDSYTTKPSRLAPLFLLPNIKVLNLTLLGYQDDEEPDFFLPPNSSTVEELSFSCCSITLQAFIKFIQGCRHLRHFLCAASSMGSNHRNDTELFRTLSRCHNSTLESLSLDSYNRRLSILATSFPRLKVLDRLSIRDLVRDQIRNTEGLTFRPSDKPQTRAAVSADPVDGVDVVELRDALPSSLEKLGLSTHTVSANRPDFMARNAVLRAVADLVEDERFSNLKQICLRGLLNIASDDEEWDPHALKRINQCGIDTHLQHSDFSPFWLATRRHKRQHRDGNLGLVVNETDPRELRELQ